MTAFSRPAHARALASIAIAILASSLGACGRKAVEVEEPTWVRTPAEDTGALCLDVHAARACWAGADAGSDAGAVSRAPRATPNDYDRWRCAGERAARVCRRRFGTSGAFECAKGKCEQEHVRAPSDGEWECFERWGAIVCRGGEPAAGVVGGRRDEAWLCGDGRGAQTPTRVCVDFAPDRPADRAFGACVIEEAAGHPKQVCSRRAEPSLGSPCDADAACPPGATCAGGVCLPSAMPRPSCWLDTDCAAGEACLYATCARAK